MAMFKGFKPQGLQKIANSMGYTGSLEGFDSYLQQNPDKQNMMNMYNQRAVQMAQGGAVRRMQVGGAIGNPADMEQFPIAELPPIPNPSGIRPMYEAKQPVGQNVKFNLEQAKALDKQIAGAGIYGSSAQLQGMRQPRFEANVGIGNKTDEELFGLPPREVGITPVIPTPFIPNDITSQQPQPQPQPLPQQYIPQIDDQYLGVPEEGADPYANYRQNVETFPETGTFKNPAIQAGFDTMQEELSKELAPTPAPEDLKRRSDAILGYVQNIYSGPLYREDGKTFTEEFKQYAKDSGISVDGSLLNVQEGSPFATIPGYIPPAPATAGSIGDITGKLAFNPALPEGATATAVGIGQSPDQMLQQGTGQVSGTVSVPTAMASTTMAEQPGCY
jgi:hypothetical protein